MQKERAFPGGGGMLHHWPVPPLHWADPVPLLYNVTDSEIQILLRQAGVVRNACDLDLLVFLWRHPRALLTSDRLAQTLGYSPVQIGSALDRLIEEGLLERAQIPSRATRLYLLVLEGESGEATERLLSLARDPEVRRALLRALDGHGPQPEDTIARGRSSLRIVGRRR